MSDTHKQLIQKVSELEQFQDSKGKAIFKARRGHVMVKAIKDIDPLNVHYSATLLATLHNISGSDTGSGWQLYDLIQAYFTDENKREKINIILNTKHK